MSVFALLNPIFVIGSAGFLLFAQLSKYALRAAGLVFLVRG